MTCYIYKKENISNVLLPTKFHYDYLQAFSNQAEFHISYIAVKNTLKHTAE